MKHTVLLILTFLLLSPAALSDESAEIYKKEMQYADYYKGSIPKDQICIVTYDEDRHAFPMATVCLTAIRPTIILDGTTVKIKALPLLVFIPGRKKGEKDCNVHWRASRSPMPVSEETCHKILRDFAMEPTQ